MQTWLAGFAYRIDIGWGAFVTAGLSLVVVTLSTVSYQSIKAAVVNPADSLRTE